MLIFKIKTTHFDTIFKELVIILKTLILSLATDHRTDERRPCALPAVGVQLLVFVGQQFRLDSVRPPLLTLHLLPAVSQQHTDRPGSNKYRF